MANRHEVEAGSMLIEPTEQMGKSVLSAGSLHGFIGQHGAVRVSRNEPARLSNPVDFTAQT